MLCYIYSLYVILSLTTYVSVYSAVIKSTDQSLLPDMSN